MGTTIPDEEIQQILYNCWEDIACFAYEGYNTNGRGVAHSLHERSPRPQYNLSLKLICRISFSYHSFQDLPL